MQLELLQTNYHFANRLDLLISLWKTVLLRAVVTDTLVIGSVC